MMKLITEQTTEIKVLSEEVAPGKKTYFIEGVFLQAAQKNRNGRIYPVEILQREINRYNTEHISNGNAYGEMDHPEDLNIKLERACIIYKEQVKQAGNDFYTKAQVLDNAKGKDIQAFIEAGARLGVSSRGAGSIRETAEADYVEEDYYLVTPGDVVANPSAPDAFVRGILEGREFIFKDGLYTEQHIEQAKRAIREAPSRRLEEEQVFQFARWLRILSTGKHFTK